MVILLPGMYTVDKRLNTIASKVESTGTPSAGAAMWMPTLVLPLLKFSKLNASSISVVVASSMLKQAALASGKSPANVLNS